jgi:hypothetical protein
VPNLRDYLLEKVYSAVFSFVLIFQVICFLKIFMEILEADFIALLKFAEIGCVLLNSVICEMYEFVSKLFQTEFL